MAGLFSIVATPIGNLSDISLRALETLRAADLIACEDTRHSRKLLAHYGIDKPLLPLHEHNEQEATEKVLAALATGRHVALISDAGTPGISDPGARAVAMARAAGHRVTPIPGPSAAIAAFSVAGFGGPFHFVGFLPAKAAAREKALMALKPLPAHLVFYEAPHRIAETIAALATLYEPVREIFIARELTKLHEETVRLPLTEAPAWLAAEANRRRGEFVLIVSAPPAPCEQAKDEADRVLRLLLAELPVSQAVRLAAAITGQPKNRLYSQALVIDGG